MLEDVHTLAHDLGLVVGGLIPSPLLGPAGNVEFLIWLRRGGATAPDPEPMIQAALDAAQQLRRA